jgi:hypothetical protein
MTLGEASASILLVTALSSPVVVFTWKNARSTGSEGCEVDVHGKLRTCLCSGMQATPAAWLA